MKVNSYSDFFRRTLQNGLTIPLQFSVVRSTVRKSRMRECFRLQNVHSLMFVVKFRIYFKNFGEYGRDDGSNDDDRPHIFPASKSGIGTRAIYLQADVP